MVDIELVWEITVRYGYLKANVVFTAFRAIYHRHCYCDHLCRYRREKTLNWPIYCRICGVHRFSPFWECGRVIINIPYTTGDVSKPRTTLVCIVQPLLCILLRLRLLAPKADLSTRAHTLTRSLCQWSLLGCCRWQDSTRLAINPIHASKPSSETELHRNIKTKNGKCSHMICAGFTSYFYISTTYWTDNL